jgi:DNA-binding LytR/AlgR family response regulator
LSQLHFIIVDNDQTSILKTKAIAESFQNLSCVGVANSIDNALDVVLEKNPELIFLEINPDDKNSDIHFGFIDQLHRFMPVVPKIIITSKGKEAAYDAIKYGAFDYLLQPIEQKELRKTLAQLIKENKQTFDTLELLKEENSNPLKIAFNLKADDLTEDNTKENSNKTVLVDNTNEKEQNQDFEEEAEEKPIVKSKPVPAENHEVTFVNNIEKENQLTICVKSYGDYRYINAKDICYLQADNNSTDIHLNNGEMITAFKTLKHFEAVLNHPFVRIHNSYIVNIDYISRIHTGNAVCHIKESTTKLPFSKSYKENVDEIIATIASGNYLEI